MGKFLESCITPVVKDSTVHGMKYLAQRNRPVWERIIWLVIILTSTAASFYFIYILVQKFIASPVIVSFQPSDTTIGDIPFPAITVCNNNRFRKSSVEQEYRSYINGSEEERNASKLVLRSMDHICSLAGPFHAGFGYSLNETTLNLCGRVGIGCGDDKDRLHAGMDMDERHMGLLRAFQTCEQIIPLCVWGGETVDCDDLFHWTFTDMGMCCTFNMMPRDKLLNLAKPSPIDKPLNDNESDFWTGYARKFDKLLQAEPGSESDILMEHKKHLKFQSKAGQVSGLSFLLNLEPEEYFCSGFDSFGFRVLAHSVIEPPSVQRYGMQIPPNSEVFMSITAEVTRSDDSVKGLHKNTRQCFFSDERPLDSFTVYTDENCIYQCVAEEIALKCNCTRLDMPLKFVRKELENTSFCEGVGFHCARMHALNISMIGLEVVCRDWECRPSCNKIQYKAQTSSLPLRQDFSVDTKFQEENGVNVGKNVTVVYIFFGSDNVYSRVRKQLYEVNDFCAQIGGILGLFLGMSFLSLFEAVNFLFKVVARNRKPIAQAKVDESKPHLLDWTKAWDWDRTEKG